MPSNMGLFGKSQEKNPKEMVRIPGNVCFTVVLLTLIVANVCLGSGMDSQVEKRRLST